MGRAESVVVRAVAVRVCESARSAVRVVCVVCARRCKALLRVECRTPDEPSEEYQTTLMSPTTDNISIDMT